MTQQQKVLVVEDDAWLRDTFVDTLHGAGFAVDTASHAQQAMDKLDDFHPDVLLLDVFLPGASGFALLHEMRSYADTAPLPVVVITTAADDLASIDLQPYGVIRLLDKTTVKPDEIIAAVRKALL